MERMFTKIIVFYDEQYRELLEKSISQNIKIIEWISINPICECIEEYIEQVKPYYLNGS